MRFLRWANMPRTFGLQAAECRRPGSNGRGGRHLHQTARLATGAQPGNKMRKTRRSENAQAGVCSQELRGIGFFNK